MSRSQGAANNGWPPPQRHPAGEPDPHTAGRPAQRPQVPQYSTPQQPQGYPQQPQGYPQQQAYAEPQQPAYAPQPQAPQQRPAAYAPQPQQAPPGYHYPQQATPQYAGQQRPAAPPQAAPQPAPAANRQALSSLGSARNGQQAHDFDNVPRTQPPQYGRQAPQPAQRAQYAPPAPDNPIDAAMMGYRQPAAQAAPAYAPQRQPAAPSYDAWPPAQAPQDTFGQGSGDFLQPDARDSYSANGGQPQYDGQHDWGLPASGYVDPGLADQQAYARGGHYDHQGHAGALEPAYNQQEEAGYEAEEPRRRSWTMRIAGAVVVAIGLGYGLAQAYSALLGGAPVDPASPPVIASDTTPAKEKPEDPGGRQFSHTDSKVLGRLGENEAAPDHSAGLSDSDADGNGARQVKTLVVGRDGSIAPPSAEPVASHDEPVSVPGLTVVDAFGSAGQQNHAPPPQQQPQQPEPQRVAAQQEEPPQQRSGMNVKTTKVIPASTASIPEEEPAAAPPKRQKVAVQTPSAAPAASSGGGGANGYVVVLASVPASGTSRLDALRKFADMQQQYGPVLASKTPDVRETTLAGKGPYHRLLVGPPGSKAQASELCTQLKAYGYKDCWVTAY